MGDFCLYGSNEVDLFWVAEVGGKPPDSAVNWRIDTPDFNANPRRIGKYQGGKLTYDPNNGKKMVLSIYPPQNKDNGLSNNVLSVTPFALGASTVDTNTVGVMDTTLYDQQINFSDLCTSPFIQSSILMKQCRNLGFDFSLKPFTGLGAAPIIQLSPPSTVPALNIPSDPRDKIYYPNVPAPNQPATFSIADNTQYYPDAAQGQVVPFFEFRLSPSDPKSDDFTVFNISYTTKDNQVLYLSTSTA